MNIEKVLQEYARLHLQLIVAQELIATLQAEIANLKLQLEEKTK